ncbi:MAG: TonB-dependent receptor plug domain-containing protein [Bacteroidales bacterium]|nr:TonB-dependent receptor plug domain-containing protein [Bacteroidales bacterium]
MKKTVLLPYILSCLMLLCSNAALSAQDAYQQDTTASLYDILEETVFSVGISDINRSSLRLKNISKEKVKTGAIGKTFPEVISNTASVYATRETGSFGDASINIRGFKQENISILLNGIPISGLTSGNMYWNNWAGLADATSAIQLQKGIGNSMISDNSVGGTINIITLSPGQDFGYEAGFYHSDYGNNKGFMNISSGDLGKGWAFALSGSYTWGEGYVECTDVSAWSYLLSVGKKINSRHSLMFTALGSPEQHSQRSNRVTFNEIEKYGSSYNKNWGWHNGTPRTISRNNYFKPYFTLNHSFHTSIGAARNVGFTLSSAVYLAIGDGGGYYTESTGRRIISFIGSDGHIDWDGVIANNRNQTDSEGGHPSANITSDYLAGHTQFGAKSSAEFTFASGSTIEAGIHYQTYDTWERERITDLLGGDYWLDNGEKKKVGDYIRTDNGRNMDYLTVYGFGTKPFGSLKQFILSYGVSASGVSIKRWDKYNYTPDNIWSKAAVGIGASAKSGLLYKVSRSHSLYANGGIYSRAPYAGVYFASGNNQISQNVRNEKNFLFEAGHRYVGRHWGAETTLYSALWKNKTIKSNPYKPLEEESYMFMVTGLDSFHYGFETEAFYSYRDIFRIDAMASVGSWKWKNNVNTTIYDPYTGTPVQEIHIYSDGLHVGDAPQTQIGATLDFHPLALTEKLDKSDLLVKLSWSYNDRFWSDFDPISRTDPNNTEDSFRIPAYHLVNLNLSWRQTLSKGYALTLFCNANNLFDAVYIERGKDGATHDMDTFSGYWGAARNFNFGARISFR